MEVADAMTEVQGYLVVIELAVIIFVLGCMIGPKR
jgi:hypothetical protein